MAQLSQPASKWQASAFTQDALTRVRLEVRHGSAKPVTHELAEDSLLIGSVAGCDLRLPGANLPPVLCLLTRHKDGVTLRKLAPVLPILVNGQPATFAPLKNGDRITLGAIDLLVQMVAGAPEAAPAAGVQSKDPGIQLAEWENRLKEQDEELETDRAIWYKRRQQLEEECRGMSAQAAEASRQKQQHEKELAQVRADISEREKVLAQVRQEIEKKHSATVQGVEEMDQAREEVISTRKELASLRQQLYDRYRERRDRLAGLQEAVRKAARKVQDRKRVVDAEAIQIQAARLEADQRRAVLNDRETELANQRNRLQEEERLLRERFSKLQEDLDERLADCQEREQAVLEERRALEKGQDEHQADLVRLDRFQGVLERRHMQLQVHAREVDLRFEQLQRDSRLMEEQAAELDRLKEDFHRDAEEFERDKNRHTALITQVKERAATLESQQALLTSLRTRLEKLREDVRSEQAQVTERQAAHASQETDLQSRLQEAHLLRTELDAEKRLFEQERGRLQERQLILEQAVSRLRQVQETLAADEARIRAREDELTRETQRIADKEAAIDARELQFVELKTALDREQTSLTERHIALTESERAVNALQEQLRNRSDELTRQYKSIEEQLRHGDQKQADFQGQQRDWQQRLKQEEEQLAQAQAELKDQQAETARLRGELIAREEALRLEQERLAQAATTAEGVRTQVSDERRQWQEDQHHVAQDLSQRREEIEQIRNQALAVQDQLPPILERAQAALDKLNQTRSQLGEYLTEIHAFAQDSRADLEKLRTVVLKDADQVRRQENDFNSTRDGHRLAVAAFRQQLLDWQNQVQELRQSLVQGENRLERRQAEVEEQARRIDSTTQELAQQAEALGRQEREVAQRRTEMERHLHDLRDWYRQKLRELAGVDKSTPAEDPQQAAPISTPIPSGEEDELNPAEGPRDILSLTGHVEPADRQLGDLLRTMQLIDADTLTALLVEARRQRRSLRQVLLAGGYLTLYQMALIETGKVESLALGPLRVIDRLNATAKEQVYRVFDPRANTEGLLRHLSESAARKPQWVSTFESGFTKAIGLRHPSLAATWEVLSIAGRPAVLQEYIPGLPSGDWPALMSAPAVWFRLVGQSALAIRQAHDAGMVHGHLEAAHVVISPEGLVKINGFGEPGWLAMPAYDEQRVTALDDLKALGRLALAWSQPPSDSKRTRAKSMPTVLQKVLNRLTATEAKAAYPDAGALLTDLEAAQAAVPVNPTAWDRFLKQVREQLGEAKPALLSA